MEKKIKENAGLEYAIGEIFCKVQDLSECYGAYQVGHKGAEKLIAETAAEIVEACGLVGDALTH